MHTRYTITGIVCKHLHRYTLCHLTPTLYEQEIHVMKISYTVLGTNDMKTAVTFYDSLFEKTELTQIAATERMTFWQCEDFTFAIAIPFNEKPACNGNGTMIGFSVGSIDEVKRLHKKAIELGGTCDGEPTQKGPRFSGYVRDSDNNKLCFFD